MLTHAWHKSTRSGPYSDCCVEVRHDNQMVNVRDSKNPDGDQLAIPAHAWRLFVQRIRMTL